MMNMNKENKNTGNNKKLIKILCGIAALIAALAVIVGIWAYYNAENAIINKITTAQYGNQLVEKFTPTVRWQPGQNIEKKVFVENTGDFDLFVRIKMSETWVLANNNNLTINSGDEKNDENMFLPDDDQNGIDDPEGSVVYKELSQNSDWTLEDDGYWYYNKILVAGTSTSDLLKSITLALDTNMGDYEIVNYYTTAEEESLPPYDEISTEESEAATKWVVYNANIPVPAGATFTRSVSQLNESNLGYANATYTLTITSEVIPATKVALESAQDKSEIVGAPAWKFDFDFDEEA